MTGRSTSSDYWAALRWLSGNQNKWLYSTLAILDDRPEPMSSPINNPVYFEDNAILQLHAYTFKMI